MNIKCPSYPVTFTQKDYEIATKKGIDNKTLMFGAKKLNKQRNFTQRLVVMVETFKVLCPQVGLFNYANHNLRIFFFDIDKTKKTQ